MVSFQKEPLAKKKKICERPSLTGEDSNTSQQRQLMTHLSKESGYDGYLEHVRWSNAEICSLYIYIQNQASSTLWIPMSPKSVVPIDFSAAQRHKIPMMLKIMSAGFSVSMILARVMFVWPA